MSDDLISRQAVLDKAYAYGNGLEPEGYCVDVEDIQALPPAEPRWIPVTERVPKNYDCVIVTILDERGDTPFKDTDLGWYFEETNCWIVHAELRRDVVAWMPLPKPWEG